MKNKNEKKNKKYMVKDIKDPTMPIILTEGNKKMFDQIKKSIKKEQKFVAKTGKFEAGMKNFKVGM